MYIIACWYVHKAGIHKLSTRLLKSNKQGKRLIYKQAVILSTIQHSVINSLYPQTTKCKNRAKTVYIFWKKLLLKQGFCISRPRSNIPKEVIKGFERSCEQVREKGIRAYRALILPCGFAYASPITALRWSLRKDSIMSVSSVPESFTWVHSLVMV